MSGCATGREMTPHLILAGLTAIGLLLYLVAVLLRPEKF
jgi:K+-transporting ATPase KdpF subunit